MSGLIFDTHAHYNHRQFNADRDALLAGLPAQGVGRVVNIGYDIPSSRDAIALAEQYDYMYATVGFHPHDVKMLNEKRLKGLRELADHPKVVAIGEIGLDLYRNLSPFDAQQHWFLRQLEMAQQLDLPVVIHSRDADKEVYDIIYRSTARRGVIHAFSGDADLAREYVSMGFYLGIGGVITYDRTGRLKEVVRAVGIDPLVLETDCPYLTPVPYRGKRNESAYLTYVARAVAEELGMSEAEVIDATYENALVMYGLAGS